jgi:hypothetical protein
MPLELVVDDPPLEDPLPDDCVVDEEVELPPVELVEEFPPQAATPSAANTSSNAVQRRGDPIVTGCIIVLSCRDFVRNMTLSSLDAREAIVVPHGKSHDLLPRFQRPDEARGNVLQSLYLREEIGRIGVRQM